MKQYLLVTDATAEAVEKATGLRGHNTMLGAFIKTPPDPFIEALRMNGDMNRLEAALNPKPPRACHCAIVHMPPCPFAYGQT